MDIQRRSLWILCLVLLPPCATSGKLFMILIDGFRWDFTELHGPLDKLPAFKRLIRSGVKAEYMQPSFPSESSTNYYGLATGLYPESNGIISNKMYDPDRNAYLSQTKTQPFWWDEGEPIWITSEKQGKAAHMLYWEGSEVGQQGLNASFCYPDAYPRQPPWDEYKGKLKTALKALSDDNAQMIALLIGNVDHFAHIHGPSSAETAELVKQMDTFLTFALDELQRQGLTQSTDVMVFSDHGMTTTSPDRVINGSIYLDTDDIKIAIRVGPFVEVWTEPGKVHQVFARLRDASPYAIAYLAKDIPERWHITNHRRIPDIWWQADTGWTIIHGPGVDYDYIGAHGYDNCDTDMRSIFMASGPHFKVNVTTGPIEVVDVYQLMCHVIGVNPAPNNGTWHRMIPMLRDMHFPASDVTRNRGVFLIMLCAYPAWAVLLSLNNETI